MSHTPGPWNWSAPDFRADSYVLERLDKRDSDSASVWLDGAERSVLIPWDYEGYSCGIYIRPEDAHLIAAAPELLKALKDMVALVDAIANGPHKLNFRGGEYSDALSAIAKAEGR